MTFQFFQNVRNLDRIRGFLRSLGTTLTDSSMCLGWVKRSGKSCNNRGTAFLVRIFLTGGANSTAKLPIIVATCFVFYSDQAINSSGQVGVTCRITCAVATYEVVFCFVFTTPVVLTADDFDFFFFKKDVPLFNLRHPSGHDAMTPATSIPKGKFYNVTFRFWQSHVTVSVIQ